MKARTAQAYEYLDREELLDRCDHLYSVFCIKDNDGPWSDGILDELGFNSDDSGPEGYFTGVSDETVIGAIKWFEDTLESEWGYHDSPFDVRWSSRRAFIEGYMAGSKMAQNLDYNDVDGRVEKMVDELEDINFQLRQISLANFLALQDNHFMPAYRAEDLIHQAEARISEAIMELQG